MRNSLQSRVTFLFVVGMFQIALLLVFAASSEVSRRYEELFIQRGESAAEELAYKTEQLLQLGLHPSELVGYDKLCHDIVSGNEGVRYIALLDANNHTYFYAGEVTPSAHNRANTVLSERELAADNDLIIRRALPPPYGANNSIVVVVDGKLIEQKVLDFTLKILLYVSGIAIVSIGIVIYYLKVNLGRPVDRLVEQIQKISPLTRPDIHPELMSRDDEVGIVARTFDATWHTLSSKQRLLARSNTKLLALTDELELRVETRTRELEEVVEKLETLAHVDLLTGLLNRQSLDEELNQRFEHCKQCRHNFAILLADLDGFKGVNDKYGHAAGDQVLRVIGKRIRHSFRGDDSAYRIGGDEFIFIVEQFTDISFPIAIAERVKAAVTKPIVINGSNITLGVSIGVACADWYLMGEPVELVSLADEAMYEAKNNKLDYVIKNKNVYHITHNQVISIQRYRK